MITKDYFCVGDMFLAYLCFLGNCTKVGIALNVPPRVVEVIAANEGWPQKLQFYLSSCRIDEAPSGEKALRRVAVQILARQLQEIIGQIIKHLHSASNNETLVQWLSLKKKSGGPVLQAALLLDLSRALLLLSRVQGHPDIDSAELSAGELESPTFWQAVASVMSGADKLPGLDSVAIGKNALAGWQSD